MLTCVEAIPGFSLYPRIYVLLSEPTTDFGCLLPQIENESNAIIFLVETEHVIFELPLVVAILKDSLSN